MSCKVGNQTNSQEPQAVNSRVFVGNLNTFQCSKTDVERRFQRYGKIAGISMHKGYAFIQFTNPFDARSACLGEDARLIWGQTLDVNLVGEPKSHQIGRKRQNVAKTGNDWEYYYDSYYAQLGFPTPRLVPPLKRARMQMGHLAKQNPHFLNPKLNGHPPKNQHINHTSSTPNATNGNISSATLSQLKSYSTPDILICGNCREMFSEVEELVEHKKTYCKLRFTCKCHMMKSGGEEGATLLCSQCKNSFESAWDLIVHVQTAHMLNIYQLGVEENKETQLNNHEGCNDEESSVLEPESDSSGQFVENGLISNLELSSTSTQTSIQLSEQISTNNNTLIQVVAKTEPSSTPISLALPTNGQA